MYMYMTQSIYSGGLTFYIILMLFHSDIYLAHLSLWSLRVICCNGIAIKALSIAANKTPDTCQVHIYLADCSWGNCHLTVAQNLFVNVTINHVF